jgi:hypothetical protein
LKIVSPIDVRKFRAELDFRKVAVFNSSDQSWSPIPVALTATTIDAREWESLERDARHIFASFPKIMAWLRRPKQMGLAQKLFAGLSDFESEVIHDMSSENWGHVTIRMDLYWHQNEIKIIEVNCTIPAMQAYSDNVFHAWANAGGEVAGESRNVDELLDSLIAMYRMDGGRLARPRIVILHRDGDSQLGELLWLQRQWSARGFETLLAQPEALSRVGDLWVVEGVPCDLVYRHIFARGLAGQSTGLELRSNRKSHFYNPVSAHFEAKAFLALVSYVAANGELTTEVDLTDEEVKAIARRVPCSRILGGVATASTFESVAGRLADVVLKRSFGYGGQQVIMGDDWYSGDTQNRLRAMTKMAGEIDFKTFSTWASECDQSLWVAQDRMSGACRRTDVLTSRGVEVWDAWYDASIFINSRTPPICRGGVSRISKSPVVNIGTGGGLAPFFTVPYAI